MHFNTIATSLAAACCLAHLGAGAPVSQDHSQGIPRTSLLPRTFHLKATPPAHKPHHPASATPAAPIPAPQPKQTGAQLPLLSKVTVALAGGDVPEGGPKSISTSAAKLFRVADFLENIESAYFAQSLKSLKKDTNFTTPFPGGSMSIASMTRQIAAQKLVHKATLEGLMLRANEQPGPACTEILPVHSVAQYLAGANLATSAAIGAISTSLQSLSDSGDRNLIPAISSILSVKSKQDAVLRAASHTEPSSSPLDTAISLSWAVRLSLDLVNPASCSQLPEVDIIPQMKVTNPVFSAVAQVPMPVTMTFTFDAARVTPGAPLFVGWVNQANAPVYTPVTVAADGMSGTAPMPLGKGMTGVVYAALTNQAGSLATTMQELSDLTLAGPAGVLFS